MISRRLPLALALTLTLVVVAAAVSRAAEKDTGKVPLTTTSDVARTAFLQGRDLAERLRGQEARAFFERAVGADPKLALAWLGLANTQPNAQAFFEKLGRAVDLVDLVSLGERLQIRGAEAGGRGDVAAQVKLYEELVRLFPGDERALVLLGNAHFGAQRYREAIDLYERAARIAPRFSQIYNQLGYSYRFLGEMEKAERAFKTYTEVLPDDPNPYDSYAELLLKLGRFDESIALYRKALAVRPDFVNSRFGIATCLDLQGKGGEARRELDTMLAEAKDDGQRRAGLFAKTVSYVFEGNLAAAQEELSKQLALATKIQDELGMAGDSVFMGDLAIAAGDLEAAAGHYERAVGTVEKAPDVASANKENQRRFDLYNRAKLALAKGDLESARRESAALTKAVSESGNPFQVRLGHEIAGRVALAEKSWATAIAELEAANQLNPLNRYRLSQAYAGQGDEARAKTLAESARSDNTLTNLNLALTRLAMKGK